jgi:hypothetical protein
MLGVIPSVKAARMYVAIMAATVAVTWSLLSTLSSEGHHRKQISTPLPVALPKGWDKLDLTVKQKLAIDEVQMSYKTRLQEHEQAMRNLRVQRSKALYKILTSEKKKRLSAEIFDPKTEAAIETEAKPDQPRNISFPKAPSVPSYRTEMPK